MHFLVIALIVAAVIYGPQMWARYVFRRHAKPREDIPGSGGELARHLLDRFELQDVAVEQTDQGDHYDPEARVVRLSADNYQGRSLTAVAVAAHEVGHAVQHGRGEALLAARTRLVKVAHTFERFGALAMMAIPVVALITRMPTSGLALFAVGLLSLGSATLVHLVTLPVEWDASFGKAMPVLESGYIEKRDRGAVRSILRAAAFTYVAASLASLLNLGRWLVLLRR